MNWIPFINRIPRLMNKYRRLLSCQHIFGDGSTDSTYLMYDPRLSFGAISTYLTLSHRQPTLVNTGSSHYHICRHNRTEHSTPDAGYASSEN